MSRLFTQDADGADVLAEAFSNAGRRLGLNQAKLGILVRQVNGENTATPDVPVR